MFYWTGVVFGNSIPISKQWSTVNPAFKYQVVKSREISPNSSSLLHIYIYFLQIAKHYNNSTSQIRLIRPPVPIIILLHIIISSV